MLNDCRKFYIKPALITILIVAVIALFTTSSTAQSDEAIGGTTSTRSETTENYIPDGYPDFVKNNPSNDVTQYSSVISWSLRDYSDVELSTSNPAIPNQAYKLQFQLVVDIGGVYSSLYGYYIRLPLPKNYNYNGSDEVGIGYWNALAMQALDILDADDHLIAHWIVVNQGNDYNEIIIMFDVDTMFLATTETINITTGYSINNYNMKGCTQTVKFGGLSHTISFEQLQLSPSGLGDSKNGVYASDSSALWQINIGTHITSILASYPYYNPWDAPDANGLVPAGGAWPSDKFTGTLDMLTANSGGWYAGNVYWNTNTGAMWETKDYFKNVWVEDTLTPGVTVTGLYIAARTIVPMTLTYNSELGTNQIFNYTNGEGTNVNVVYDYGMPSWESAYKAYVLADLGRGPETRDGENANPDTVNGLPMPKESATFTKISQYEADGTTWAFEDYDDFKAEILGKRWQYGLWVENNEEGIPVTTVFINFGNIMPEGSAGSDDAQGYLQVIPNPTGVDADGFVKYSDITDVAYSDETLRTDFSRYPVTDGDWWKNFIRVPDFAIESANACIDKGFYTEDDRDELLNYFTNMYGDTNILLGSVANFQIDLNVSYPNSEIYMSDKVKSNSAEINSNKGTLAANGSVTLEDSDAKSMVPPYVRLYKLDAITQQPLSGALFELQRSTSGTDNGPWEQVGPQKTTNANGFVFWDNTDGANNNYTLTPGYYRFVEVLPPENYLMVGNGISEVFYTEAGTASANTIFMKNANIEKVPYIVHHFREYWRDEQTSTPGPDFSLLYGDDYNSQKYRVMFDPADVDKDGVIDDTEWANWSSYAVDHGLDPNQPYLSWVDKTWPESDDWLPAGTTIVVDNRASWPQFRMNGPDTTPVFRYILNSEVANTLLSGEIFAAYNPAKADEDISYDFLQLNAYYRRLTDISFTKTDSTGTPLNGAEFALYTCREGPDIGDLYDYTEPSDTEEYEAYLQRQAHEHDAFDPSDPDCCWVLYINDPLGDPYTRTIENVYIPEDPNVPEGPYVLDTTRYNDVPGDTYPKLAVSGTTASNRLNGEVATDELTPGEVRFNDLVTGTYLLVETKTLRGYQLPAGQWVIEVNAALGRITEIKAVVDENAWLGLPAFKVENAGTDLEIYELPNYKEMTLPFSGGYGVLIFSVVGIVLLGMAVILIVCFYKKKK